MYSSIETEIIQINDIISKLNSMIEYIIKENNSLCNFKKNKCHCINGCKPTNLLKTGVDEYKKMIIYLRIIQEILDDFGIHKTNKGYYYIIDSVAMIMQQDYTKLHFKSEIYPYVADGYKGIRSSSVEHSIRNAIHAAYRDQLKSVVVNKMSDFENCPGNKQFLIIVSNLVYLRYQDVYGVHA